MALANNNNELEISEDQVANYLKNHPGFFLKRDDLLCELKLSHPSGTAVSLLERQVNLLRERNMDMRHRLSDMLGHGETNDLLFDKTNRLILSLIEAKTIDALARTCRNALLNDFQLPFAALILLDPPSAPATVRTASRAAAQEAVANLLNNKLTCGVLRDKELQFLFGDQARNVGSAAVVPLNHHGTVGILAIGSDDAHYFRADMGNLFIQHIADVLTRLLAKLQAGH